MKLEATLPAHLRFSTLLLASAASGVMLFTAFPPADMGPLAWVALVPLFLALSQTRNVWQGGACGFVTGLTFFGFYFQFLFMYGVLPWAATVIYQSLPLLLFGLLAGPAMRVTSPVWRVLGATSAWGLAAYTRAYLAPIGFTGGDLAYSQYDQLPIIQIVSVVGHLGLTFGIAAVNAALSQALLGVLPFPMLRPATDLKRWSQGSAAVAVACYIVLIASYIGGALTLKLHQSDEGRSIEVAVVQGDVQFDTPTTIENVYRSRDAYVGLNETVPQETDLTIWPEDAFPVYLQLYPDMTEAVQQAARATDGYLLMGTMQMKDDKYYNSAILWDSQGEQVDDYHKMDLVAFGEFVPFRKELPFLSNYPIRQHDITPGDSRKVFDVNGIAVSPLICFEGMFSRPSREVCQMGAEVIAIITSDAWADETIEVEQHSRTAVFRAVESRRYVCRAASSGISAIYDPFGEELTTVPQDTQGVIAHTVYGRDALSIYHRIGDMPLVIVCVILLGIALYRRKADG